MSEKPTQGFRLSPQQRRLWSLGAEAAPFRLRLSFELTGRLEEAALRRALDALVVRHEILRTRLRTRPGLRLPFQSVLPEHRPSFVERDLRRLEPAEGLGAQLSSLGEERSVLLLELPALAADPASAAVLGSDLARLYEVELGGEPDEELAIEPPQYADYAEVFNDLLEDPEMEPARSFWHAYDLGALPEAPGADRRHGTNHHGAETAGFAPCRVALPLAEIAAGAPSMEAKTCEALFFAGWIALICRLSGEPRTVVGSLLAGRSYEELDAAIGPYARYLPVGLEAGETLSFAALTAAARRALDEAAEWQEVFAWEAPSATPGAVGHFPLGFDFLDGAEVWSGGGLRFALAGVEGCYDRFDLRLAVERLAEGVAATLVHDRGRVDPATAERLAAALARLLGQAAAAPQRALGTIELLSESERRQLLALGDRSTPETPEAPLVHLAFELQARRHPHRVAVLAYDAQMRRIELRYGELDRRANQLARWLRSRGAGPEVLVGLCANRSAAMVVGLLGILKAGAAYVPFEAGEARDRLVGQLGRVGCRLLVTEPELKTQLAGFEGEVLSLAAADPGLGVHAEAPVLPQSRPEHLAYVLFTSGSTGAPKGVMIRHANIAAYNRFLCRRLELGATDEEPTQLAMVSTFGADLGNTVLFPALTTGGCLHLLDARLATDGAQLAAHARREPIDVLKIVPSHLGALLAWPELREVLPRRALVVGGELFSHELLERVATSCPGEVINHYGPTETTVGSLTFAARGEPELRARALGVPIGRPIDGTRVCVVDHRGRLTLEGVAGELLIGGAGVARGYLDRPGETAARFVPDCFSDRAGERLYRTGDLVRSLGGGVLEYLRRIDDQVKIRGFRIEPAEVAAALAGHPRVARAIAVARDEGDGAGRRLVAYLVPTEGTAAPTPSEWRAYLGTRLPDAMIPAAFVTLDRLPLTPNGKLDVRALPAPDRAEGVAEHQPPRTETEAALCRIWAELLRCDRVGVGESFFALGGDSILAIQMVVKAREIGLELTPLQVFQHPTLAELAAVASAIGAPPPEPSAVPAASAGYPLSPIQQGVLFDCLYRPRPGLYTSQLSYVLGGELDPEALESAWRQLLERHAILRTSFSWERVEEPLQGVHEHVAVPLERLDWRGLETTQLAARSAELLTAERERGFDFRRPPLLRLVLIRLDEDRWRFVWTYHHLVMDGWSEPIVLSELLRCYAAAREGGSAELPMARPYTDYVAWLLGRDLSAAERYWRGLLAGFTRPTPLGAATAAGPDATAPAAPVARELRRRLDRPATAALGELGRARSLTLYTIAQGAWALLLSALSGERDVVFGTTLAGRPPALEGVADMVGPFINTLPVRVRVEPGEPLAVWLGRLQTELALMREHEHCPLVAVLGWSEVPRGTPLFESLFVFQNLPLDPLLDAAPATGIDLGEEEFRGGATAYPLSVDVVPAAELAITMTYDPERFEPAIVEGHLESFEMLLRLCAERPEAPLGELLERLAEHRRQSRERQAAQLEQLSQEKLRRSRRRLAEIAP